MQLQPLDQSLDVHQQPSASFLFGSTILFMALLVSFSVIAENPAWKTCRPGPLRSILRVQSITLNHIFSPS